MNLNEFFLNNRDLKYHAENINFLVKTFHVHKGTARRWIEKGEIPDQYTKNKDQFYTTDKMAKSCLRMFKDELNKLGIPLYKYTYLEPSAGRGAFYRLFPKNKRLGMDIEPRFPGIKRENYLKWKPQTSRKFVILGNPPFGLRGNMALKFINHSYPFVDVIGLILPQLFESDGKGAPMKRVKGYKLAYSKKLKDSLFKGKKEEDIHVNVIFQIWTKINTDKINRLKKRTCRSFIKVYSLSDGGTPSSTRNKKMLYKCDVYLPSTCFNGMKAYRSFEELPHRRGYGVVIKKNRERVKRILKNHNWTEESFKSTNSALNLRTSLIENVLIKNNIIDL